MLLDYFQEVGFLTLQVSSAKGYNGYPYKT